MSRGPYRRHSPQFKLELCSDIRSGVIGRREVQRKHKLSANLIQLWLTQFDAGTLCVEEAEASMIDEYEQKIATLERKVGQLTMEVDLLKKNTATPVREHQRELIHRQRPRGCSIRGGCKVINLPRSTYYYCSQRTSAALCDERLVELIGDIQDQFPGYGYRRVTRALYQQGYHVNHKRIARIMREYGLGVTPRRRFVTTTDSDHELPIFPNLYRNMIPPRPDLVWVADITFIRLNSGFAYLAVILDACSRKVVGYALSQQIDTSLTLAALHAAYALRKPAPGTCIHHSDRGSQYLSIRYSERLSEAGFNASVGSVGDSYDNALAESINALYKAEVIHNQGPWQGMDKVEYATMTWDLG
jgi:putative transposase